MKKNVYIPIAVLLAVLLMSIPSLIQTEDPIQLQQPDDTPKNITITDPDFLFLGRRYRENNELGEIKGMRLPVTQKTEDGSIIKGYMEVAYLQRKGRYSPKDYDIVVLLDSLSTPIGYPVERGLDELRDSLFTHCNSSAVSLQGELYQYKAWNEEDYLVLRVDPEIYSISDKPKPLDLNQLEPELRYAKYEEGIRFTIRNLSEDKIIVDPNVDLVRLEQDEWIPYDVTDVIDEEYWDTVETYPGTSWFTFYEVFYMKPGKYKATTTVHHLNGPEIQVEATLTIEDRSDPELIQRVKDNPVNGFAIDYYSTISSEQENLVFSPYCMSTLFSILLEGARGETATEIMKVFHLNEDYEINRELLTMYMDELEEINSVNGLWMHENFPFNPEYVEIMRNAYQAETENVDFSEPEPVRVEVNKWIEERTNGKIEELFPENSFSSMTRLVAANTLYFNDDWANQFEVYDTRSKEFHLSPNETIKVDTMTMNDYFNYTEKETVQVLEMPYENSGFSMIMLLPVNHTLQELESSLTPDLLGEYIGALTDTSLKIYIPKFEYKIKYDLGKILPEMGMPLAFEDANFTGISEWGDLFLSEAYHETYIRVDEKGTEAAAATGGIVAQIGGMGGREFRADHPFMYLIMDKETGSILFMGRVKDPSK